MDAKIIFLFSSSLPVLLRQMADWVGIGKVIVYSLTVDRKSDLGDWRGCICYRDEQNG